ncbi:MAG TPA: YbaK/EbsC family protein [Xanthobacteraceae bacterium]|nr:YbaK/EbsC family protein [Xanthobacteraceae bacterium]
MGVAATLAQYLADRGVAYDVIKHPHTETAWASAEAGHLPADRLAKAVVLKEDEGFLLAVLAASRHIKLGELRDFLGSDVDLANERQIATIFRDCERGAVPPLGAAYGLKVVVDDSLTNAPEIYLEAGDHASLVHMSGASFRELLAEARHGWFTEPA